MKLKLKLNKAEFDILPEHFKSLYTASGEDYTLTGVELPEDKSGKLSDLEKELNILKTEKSKLDKQKLDDVEAVKRAEFEKAKKDGDIQALERSWGEKYDNLVKVNKEISKKYKDSVKSSLIDNAVNKIVGEISLYPDLMKPHVLSRLDVDFDSEQPLLFVKDSLGKRSALSIEELTKELSASDLLKPLIKGSAPTGGKANDFTLNPKSPTGEPVRFSNMTLEQLAGVAKQYSETNRG